MQRILIVDDELAILSGMSRFLYDLCGFQGDVRTVINGREALYETGQCFYDICFLDIHLPDINGLDVIKDINAISPSTNIILMSAGYTETDLKKTIDDNCAFYLEKPFDYYQIKHVMKLAMECDNDYLDGRGTGKKGGRIGRRKFRRRRFEKIINFYVSTSSSVQLKGSAVDISYSGIGIQTCCPLERGDILIISTDMINKTGFIAWSSKRAEDNYRVGIKFL